MEENKNGYNEELTIKEKMIKEYLEKSEYFKSIKNIDKFVKKLNNAFPTFPVIEELKKMEFWLYCNPNRLKKRYDRFICNWLMKATRMSNISKNE
jgi:hypothetical protein